MRKSAKRFTERLDRGHVRAALKRREQAARVAHNVPRHAYLSARAADQREIEVPRLAAERKLRASACGKLSDFASERAQLKLGGVRLGLHDVAIGDQQKLRRPRRIAAEYRVFSHDGNHERFTWELCTANHGRSIARMNARMAKLRPSHPMCVLRSRTVDARVRHR